MVLNLEQTQDAKIDDLIEFLNDKEKLRTQIVNVFSDSIIVNKNITFNYKEKEFEALDSISGLNSILYTEQDHYLFQIQVPYRQNGLMMKLNHYLVNDCHDGILDKEHQILLNKVTRSLKNTFIKRIKQYNADIISLDECKTPEIIELVMDHDIATNDAPEVAKLIVDSKKRNSQLLQFFRSNRYNP